MAHSITCITKTASIETREDFHAHVIVPEQLRLYDMSLRNMQHASIWVEKIQDQKAAARPFDASY
jgi:hypothetical protein